MKYRWALLLCLVLFLVATLASTDVQPERDPHLPRPHLPRPHRHGDHGVSVPEASATVLLAIALAGLVAWRQWKRRH